MKLIILCAIILLSPAYTNAAEHLPGHPATNHSPEQCASLVEKEILTRHKDLFDLKKDTLSIRLNNGKTKTYTSTLSDNPESFVIYLLVNYYSSVNYALILVQYYEGISYQLLNMKTGEAFDVQGYALLSPQKKRLVVHEKDIDAEYSPNVLRVYRITADGILLEYDAAPNKWGPSDVRWINEREISFSKDSHDVNSPNYSKATYEAREQKRLKYLNGHWNIE